MQIYAHERGNSYGCTYFISFHEEELEIALVWNDNFFTYNKEEIESRIGKMMDLSTSIKLALYQFIEKTNYLLYLSYKELH
ncbi:hypothetical protein ACFJZD_13070 [Enterococcus faecalis]|uniref:Uncharacterized protein n=1 Tax=Enterococcus faecalis TX4248 TaxID=749495 RepID=A0A125W6W1_ENTFL|nr:hypothetical protein [Enterococcus faecalis]EFM82926.1 hypothetical protein HMPREF9498_01396 [Enterococcus faecalis TX4248]EKZ0363065.1 hypothetical protein [Enterococcus faecalis]PQD30692.1 hypothetical protein CUM64_12805 [Enterococcus faecalis]RBR39519.1 hypothetical protein EA76_02782 [Enterococcus faecalis]HAP4176892.1 hypothetical protein [Enterococcus faecalis]